MGTLAIYGNSGNKILGTPAELLSYQSASCNKSSLLLAVSSPVPSAVGPRDRKLSLTDDLLQLRAGCDSSADLISVPTTLPLASHT